MPRVRQRIPGLALTLVGTDPTPEMAAAAGHEDHITGRVADVDPFVQAATLLALPITLGGGMRVKLLEAMAVGKAIVASRLAAAGLAVQDGRELRLADDVDAWAAAIVELVGDAAARRDLGTQARAWATANLSWEARVADYEALYRRCLSPSTPPTGP